MSTIYTVITDTISDVTEAPLGKSIYYRCKDCEGLVSSTTVLSAGCGCGNIYIDANKFKLAVRDGKKFQAVEKN